MNKYLCFFLVFTLGCGGHVNNDPYADNIFRYLDEIPKLDLSKESQTINLIVIPLNGCSPCLLEVLGFLNESNLTDDLQLLFVGKSIDREVQTVVQDLKLTYPHYIDEDNMLMLYRTNISDPSLLIVQGSTIIKFTLDLTNYANTLLEQTSLE